MLPKFIDLMPNNQQNIFKNYYQIITNIDHISNNKIKNKK